MAIVIIIVIIVVVFVGYIINMEGKKKDEDAILEAADVFRRIGYGDRKAITEEWKNLKATKTKWIICEAWSKVFAEFQEQGNTEAIDSLTYEVGDEVLKYLEELRDFCEKTDEGIQNRRG